MFGIHKSGGLHVHLKIDTKERHHYMFVIRKLIHTMINTSEEISRGSCMHFIAT